MGRNAGRGSSKSPPPPNWRSELLDPALTVLAVAFALSLAIGTPLVPPPRFRAPFFALLGATLILIALRLARGLPMAVRAGGAALATLVVMVLGVSQLGVGPGLTTGLVLVGVMLSISIGRAAALLYFLLTAASLLALGLMAVRGELPLRPGAQDPTVLANWVRWIAVFTICGATLAMVLHTVVRRVEQSAQAQIAADEEHRRSTDALLALVEHASVESGRVEAAFAAIAEAAARGLEVARAGVWRIDEAGGLRCGDLYSRTDDLHAAGASLSAADHPAYLAALADGRALAVSDAHLDPRTRELSPGYLAPAGVTSILVAPIRFRDQLAGAVCLEHVGAARTWSAEAKSFAASLADLAARALAAAERNQQEQELRGAYDALGRLHRQVENAKEEERRRLARDLHDELGQTLTALKLRLQMAGKAPSGGVPADAVAMVDRLIGHTRQLSIDLSPPLLDEVGLAPAIRAHLEAAAAPPDLRIDLDTAGLDERLPAEVETAAFRVVQESLTNAFRHAQARRVEISVRRDDGHLLLRVQDDGRGFDLAEARRATTRGEHFGVVGMAERVKGLGGTLEVRSAPGKGTEVRASLPVAPPR